MVSIKKVQLPTARATWKTARLNFGRKTSQTFIFKDSRKSLPRFVRLGSYFQSLARRL